MHLGSAVAALRRLGRPARIALWSGLAATILLIIVLVAVDVGLDEPLRNHLESKLNSRLQGYRVSLGHAHFQLLGFGIELRDLVVRQEANPEPPVARISRWSASVHWRALLRTRLVGDITLTSRRCMSTGITSWPRRATRRRSS